MFSFLLIILFLGKLHGAGSHGLPSILMRFVFERRWCRFKGENGFLKYKMQGNLANESTQANAVTGAPNKAM